jgi:hypothetical protein
MLIELQIRRPGGSKATVHGTDYHFRPRTPGGPHVDEVSDPAHVAHFLGISAFRLIEESPAETAQASASITQDSAPIARPRGRPRKT